jgi:NAD+ synthase
MDVPTSSIDLTPEVLALDCAAEAERIATGLRGAVSRMRRRGVVVAVSGGVDSAVCAALAAQAFGPERVLGLLLPERESSPRSRELGLLLCQRLGLPYLVQEISSALTALSAYSQRDEAIRTLFPDYGEGWRCKIAIAGGLSGGFNYFKLVVQDPAGRTRERRLPHKAYLQIVAAQSYKQRLRKAVEYFHADRLHYAVLGTPNKLEYDQGFFVKNGDGAADVKPIAHLYKTQVYALCRHFALPEEICTAPPTTDTYSLPQGQDEFFFALPWHEMDLALWAHDHGVPAEALGRALQISAQQALHIYRDIAAKREAARYLHAPPLVFLPG